MQLIIFAQSNITVFSLSYFEITCDSLCCYLIKTFQYVLFTRFDKNYVLFLTNRSFNIYFLLQIGHVCHRIVTFVIIFSAPFEHTNLTLNVYMNIFYQSLVKEESLCRYYLT